MRNVAVLALTLVASAVCYGLDSSSLGKAIGQSALLAAIALAAAALIRSGSLRIGGGASRRALASRVVCPNGSDNRAAVAAPAANPSAVGSLASTPVQPPARRSPSIRIPIALVCAAALLGGVISWATATPSLAASAPQQVAILVAQIAALCALTGIAEEALYRAAMIEAFLPALGAGNRAMLKAAAASALIFAALHLSIPADGSAVALAQALLKPLQAALFGFTLALLYCRMRSLWPCAALHAAFNMLYLGPSLLVSGTVATTYASGRVSDLAILIVTTGVLAFAAACAPWALLQTEKSSKNLLAHGEKLR